MKITRINTGFVELPGLNTLNIYSAGCTIKCPGCQNPELQDFNHPDAYEINIQALTEKINSMRELIDGICWLGGEPLDQHDELAILIYNFKEVDPDLKQIIYTGYTKKEILEDIDKLVPVAKCDIVKTGRWEGIPTTDPKSNQQFYFLHRVECWVPKTYEELKTLPW